MPKTQTNQAEIHKKGLGTTPNARLESAIRHIREITAFAPSDRAHYDLRDRLLREIARDFVGLTPAERERVEIEIRRRTNT
jgi:hypothetical protein